ncbi:MAG: efflux transporter outer membrane subunit [Acidobacteriaceae bacterium]|nr:efflux transporter outer membrane subunit [Acidobacteriaceae bacterium]
MKIIKKSSKLRNARILSIFAASALLAGCRVGAKYVRPNMPAPPAESYKENSAGTVDAQHNGWKQANPSDAMLRGKWWEVFQDPQLNALEERLNVNDQNIKIYFENYMAARALVRNARASLFPTVTVGPSVNAQGTGSSSTARLSTSTSSESYELSGSVSWEPDLFGSIRNTVLADKNAAQVSAAELADETLSEQSSLAQYYFELRGEDSLQSLYSETVAQYKESLRITQSLSRTGIDSEQDVAQAEATLRAAEASAVAISTTRAQYEHAIALLLGESASTFSLKPSPLVVKVPYVPTGVPSQLLERRPDIASAERTVAEYNALIGVYKAAYYPTVSLTGSGGTQSSSVSELLNVSALFWSLGASATETLMDFGARKANVQRYEALYRSNVASYRETVLTAFKEVEDYLVANRQLADQSSKEQRAVEASSRYANLANVRYSKGIDPYLDVITAETSLLNSKQALVQLQTQQMTSAVQLIAALGGGWDASQLPSESATAAK